MYRDYEKRPEKHLQTTRKKFISHFQVIVNDPPVGYLFKKPFKSSTNNSNLRYFKDKEQRIHFFVYEKNARKYLIILRVVYKSDDDTKEHKKSIDLLERVTQFLNGEKNEFLSSFFTKRT